MRYRTINQLVTNRPNVTVNTFIFKIIRQFALYILLFHVVTTSIKAQQSTPEFLTDSIRAEIYIANTNPAQLKQVLISLSKNRRNLENMYKPLMEEYIAHTRKVNFKPGLMEALDRLGHRERQEGNYQKAINYHLQSLNIATELADSNQLAYNYSNLGQAYRRQDYNAIALKYFHKALSIQQALGDIKGLYFTQNSIGATYFAQEDYGMALRYINKAVDASIKHNDKRSLSFNYGCLGEIYLAQSMVDSAINYFLLSKELKIETNQTDGLAVAHHLLGKAYFAKGYHSKAQQDFLTALAVHERVNNKRYQVLCLGYLGKIDIIQGNTYQGGEKLAKAKKLAKSIHSTENLVFIEATLADYYKKIGNYIKAFEAIENSYAYRDSLISIKAKRNVQALEIEYQTKEKQNEINLLSKNNIIKSQRIRLSIIIILLLITTFGLFASIHLQRQRNAKMLETELQQKLSCSQMNPHFLSNAMGSIQKFMYNNDTKSAAKYLGKFSQLNRAVLEHSLVDSVSLDDEISMLTNYLEFEQLRLNNAFAFSIQANDDLDVEMIKIPPLFIQPFVENAVKHGIKGMNNDGQVTIKFTDLEDTLKVEVIDNGKGISSNTNTTKEHKSRSMEITQKRYKLLKNKYKNLPSFTLVNNDIAGEQGVIVTIYLPILPN